MNFKKAQRAPRNSITFGSGLEKWRTRNLSRRDINLEEDSESEEEEFTELTNWEDIFFKRSSVNTVSSEQDMEVQLTTKQTLILSTLLPDEILLTEKFASLDARRLVGVLLMADVSGYTALSEKYSKTGKSGTYRLTVTLNTYLGALIELIYSHGGDVIKFAGDAFLALWKTDKSSYICHTIHAVITCALIIQHSYSVYETDVKVNLKVKLAIAAGNLIFTPIGKGIDMNYVIFGLPVLEAKLAESLCVSGEVKLTPTAWAHCYSRNYDYVMHEDGFVSIRAILYDPREKDVNKPFAGINTLLKSRKTFTAIEQLPKVLLDHPKTLSAMDFLRKNEALALRKTMLLAEDRNIGSEFRKFMIRPILTQIDAHQPLEYLTEIRQVSILFMTLKPDECPYMQLITIVNNSYEITCEIVYKSMGCVNKIILFDKDVMILVIFGLRGFKHESEAQAALKCAYNIKKSVSVLDGVKQVSIGVTTGQVYCGVVGHPLRREFTVIGATVNKAARLMCGYRNKITCDETTFIKSKMSQNGFTLLPTTKLKGIEHPGKIYEYTEEIRTKELFDIEIIPPLLGRMDELIFFQNWINNVNKSPRDFDALLLIGESRSGKSRLLEWMARCAENAGFKTCYVNLTSIHSATPYLALSQIINQILLLEEPVKGFMKEEKIIELLQVYNDNLCYLNNFLKVRFAFHEGVRALNENQRFQKGKNLFSKLVDSISETNVIFLDDLQNLDPKSWELISIMITSRNIMIISSITKGKFGDVHCWLHDVFTNTNIKKILLGPIKSDCIAPLACQILDVDAVTHDLSKALLSKCKYLPGIIESFILHMFSNGALKIISVPADEINNWETENLFFPAPELLRPQALNSKDQDVLDQYINENNTSNTKSICIVAKIELLNSNIDAQNTDALVMVQIDSLTPYQQLLLKIASVIGNVVSRILLENIMYENNTLTTAKAIKRLFAMRLLTCASNVRSSSFRKTSTVSSSSNTKMECNCNFEYDPEENNNLPKYAFCQIIKFRNRNTRKTCYELLPLNQKKEFHSRVVNYLENNKQKCVNCGGSVMIVQSFDNVVCERFKSKESYQSNNRDSVATDSSNTLDSSFEEKITENRNFFSTDDVFVLSNSQRTSKISNVVTTLQNSASSKKSALVVPDPLGTKVATKTTKRVTMPSIPHNTLIEHPANTDESDIISHSEKEPMIFEKFRPVVEAANINDWNCLGLDDDHPDPECKDSKIKKWNNDLFYIKLERGLSQVCFEKCTCTDVEIAIFEQLIFHAKQAELKGKVVGFQAQYAYLNIMAGASDIALEQLKEAEVTCNTKNNNDLTKFELYRYQAFIHTLKAAAYLLNQSYHAAKTSIDQACYCYDVNIDSNKILNLKNLIHAIHKKIIVSKDQKNIIKSDTLFCLNVASVIYSTLRYDRVTKTAIEMALQTIKKYECRTTDVFETFSNALKIFIDRGNFTSTIGIDLIALNFIKNAQRPLKSEELLSLGVFLVAAFRARTARGALSAALRAGYKSLAITTFLHANSMSMEIIPELFYILLARGHISKAIDLANETLRLGRSRRDLQYETWYYAFCIDLILDAGCQLEAANEITRFAEYHSQEMLNSELSSHEGYRRLIAGLWTYWLRAGSDRRVRRYENETIKWIGTPQHDRSLSSLITALRLTEGLLESLARKMDDLRKVVNMMELRSSADCELTRLEVDARCCLSIYPRWLLLKANSYYISGRTSLAIQHFNLALDEARKINSTLEESLVRASMMTSPTWMQSATQNYFITWENAIEVIEKKIWHKLLYRMFRPN